MGRNPSTNLMGEQNTIVHMYIIQQDIHLSLSVWTLFLRACIRYHCTFIDITSGQQEEMRLMRQYWNAPRQVRIQIPKNSLRVLYPGWWGEYLVSKRSAMGMDEEIAQKQVRILVYFLWSLGSKGMIILQSSAQVIIIRIVQCYLYSIHLAVQHNRQQRYKIYTKQRYYQQFESNQIQQKPMIPAQCQFVMTVFSHDSYIMHLPAPTHQTFYSHFKNYQTLRNYHGLRITQAPIIRLFGTTPTGQKACVHIHGYFPFMYVKVEHLKEGFKSPQYLKTFLALTESLYKQAYKYNHPVVFRGQLEEKYDFYGYHSCKELFLKIEVYDEHQVTKLRELFASRAINGQSLQPYNAHINLFMHLFAQLNIYGLHQMLFTNYKFRKNIVGQQQFQKVDTFSSSLSTVPGLNLSQLYSISPQRFSLLEKTSPCYIQIDVSYDNIVNYLYSMMNKCISEEERRSSLKSAHVNSILRDNKRFNVQITKALNQFWFDEIERREKHKIKEDLELQIDYSRNIQSSTLVEKGEKDVLWMNFITHQDVRQMIKVYVESYRQARTMEYSSHISVNPTVVQNYDMIIDQQISDMVQSVTDRWKFYSQRSKKLIDQIIKGQVKEIPEWDELSEGSDHEEDENDQEGGGKAEKASMKHLSIFQKLMKKQSNLGNMAQFRNNYTVNRGVVKKDGYFSSCTFCKVNKSSCKCPLFKDITSIETHQRKFFRSDNQYQRVRYSISPPTVESVLNGECVENEFPFFSSVDDLFDYYKVPKMFKRTKYTAQLLDQEVKPLNQFLNIPALKNNQRLPEFWKTSTPYQPTTKLSSDYIRLKYHVQPPTISDSISSIPPISNTQPRRNNDFTRRNNDFTRKENVFTCNIAQFNFQLFTECQSYYSNPETDRITGIVYSINNEVNPQQRVYGLILLSSQLTCSQDHLSEKIHDIFIVETQKDLLLLFALLVFKTDPDLLVSYDHQKKGIYYLVVRAYCYKLSYADILSRSLNQLDDIFDVVTFNRFKMLRSQYFTEQFLASGSLPSGNGQRRDPKNMEKARETLQNRKRTAPVLRKKYNFNVRIKGRVCINLYRILEQQKKYSCYTIEFVVKELFGQQLPEFTDKTIYQSSKSNLPFSIEYMLRRVSLLTQILQSINVVGGLIEKSKLYGCNFQSMLERGSQFKIEAIMSRVCLHSDYLLLSATKIQVAEQKVLQCRPLVLEPPKQLFVDPVLVFDFQSLYPSVMIAFNLCYSTCLGNIKQLFNKQTRLKRFGVAKQSDIDLSFLENIFLENTEEEALRKLESYIFVTPNKVAFLKSNIKEGILPRMLLQFLMSRIMIKNSSGLYKSEIIKKLLHERQAAMKLFMNVTYGYTGATFSGRMPCSQIADSIVELAKFCLTTCMKQMNGQAKYGGGSVVYGDTDSIFYHLKGKGMKEAFEIGDSIQKDMTKKFPFPIQLKFQKVYESLVLVSKKRYYGKKYQSFGGKPKYEGKGLELVRRDTIALVSDNMTQLLNNLFDQKDLSITKRLFQEQVARVRSGLTLPKELVFAKEVKLLKYGALVPAHGQAARKLENIDAMLAPKYGQRMKYLVLKQGPPAIKDRSLPLFLFKNEEIDSEYYISKHFLPSLQRVFTSIVDFQQWQSSTSKKHNRLYKHAFSSKYCIVCGHSNTKICEQCVPLIDSEIENIQISYHQKLRNCKECINSNDIDEKSCIEWNCQNLWERKRAEREMEVLIPQLISIKKAVEEFIK